MVNHVITKIIFSVWHALDISCTSHMNMIISHYEVSFSIEGNWGSEVASPFSVGHTNIKWKGQDLNSWLTAKIYMIRKEPMTTGKKTKDQKGNILNRAALGEISDSACCVF